MKGLQYLHNRSFIHRNLKCNNILINSKGLISIWDFGFGATLKYIPNRKTFIGSPWWMSP